MSRNTLGLQRRERAHGACTVKSSLRDRTAEQSGECGSCLIPPDNSLGNPGTISAWAGSLRCQRVKFFTKQKILKGKVTNDFGIRLQIYS